MKIGIYAIFDVVAQMIIGGLQLHRHHAAAIRMFGDVASAKDTAIAQHPKDFNLIFLGQLNDDNTIMAIVPPEVVISGSAWLAAQSQPGQLELVQEAK